MRNALDKLTTIFPATAEMRDAGAAKLAGISAEVDLAQLERLTAEGFIQAAVVNVDSTACFVVWYNIGFDRVFHVNVAVQLLPGDRFDNLVAAIECLARKLGCVGVRFNTTRLGLLAKANRFGYAAKSVCVIKHF